MMKGGCLIRVINSSPHNSRSNPKSYGRVQEIKKNTPTSLFVFSCVLSSAFFISGLFDLITKGYRG